MYSYKYPRPALTVDIVVFAIREDRLHVLLIQRAAEPFKGLWALPGGFVEIEESLDEAAHRELKEETGLEGASLEQFYTFGQPDRDPRGRVVTVAYFALAPANATIRPEGGTDACQAQWCPVDELPQLAFDHKDIISYAVAEAKAHRLIPHQ